MKVETSPTFTAVMESAARAFEALGALVLIVGVLWSVGLAAIVWRREAEDAALSWTRSRAAAMTPSGLAPGRMRRREYASCLKGRQEARHTDRVV